MRVYRREIVSEELQQATATICDYMDEFPAAQELFLDVLEHEDAYAYANAQFTYDSTIDNVEQISELRSIANAQLLMVLRKVDPASHWRDLEAHLRHELDEADKHRVDMVAFALGIAGRIQQAHTCFRFGKARDACELAETILEDLHYVFPAVSSDVDELLLSAY